MDNKKNTILLTVIAVATLLVAVVGATFAYFTAQGGGSDQTDIEVRTETASSSTITVTETLNLVANLDNFNESEKGHLTSDTATGTVNWTPSTGATDDELNFCYTVELDVADNDFEYATALNTAGIVPTVDASYYNTAELVFNITKNGTPVTGSTSGSVTNLTYATVGTTLTGSRPEVSGWDITTANNAGSYNVTDGTDNVHQITGTAGDLSTDNWSATVTLINKNIDQLYNTDKAFHASLVFTEVACS